LRYFRDKWFFQNIRDFLTYSKSTAKNNLIIASEEFIYDIYTDYDFLSLNAPAKRTLARDYLKADLVYESMDKNGDLEYLPVYPLYEERSVLVGLPPISKYSFAPLPYKFKNKNGTITGVTLYNGHKYEIKPTG
jgi:hypothetical protein